MAWFSKQKDTPAADSFDEFILAVVTHNRMRFEETLGKEEMHVRDFLTEAYYKAPKPVPVQPVVNFGELDLAVAEFIVAGLGSSDFHNRQHRHHEELRLREGIENAQLTLSADEQKHAYTEIARLVRAARQDAMQKGSYEIR